MENCKGIPNQKGVYLVIFEGGARPTFVEKGSGGHYKDRDPNVPISELVAKWIEGAQIVNIGQTESSLKKRICQYMRFGQGKSVAHHGGRYIWQIQDHKNLIVCWKAMSGESESAKVFECQLIQEFEKDHGGRLPFANLKG